MVLPNEGRGDKRCYSPVPRYFKPEVGWELLRLL